MGKGHKRNNLSVKCVVAYTIVRLCLFHNVDLHYSLTMDKVEIIYDIRMHILNYTTLVRGILA